MNGPESIVLRTEGLEKTFPSGESELRVLLDVNIEFRRGEIVSVVGASGVGKSTLLHVIGTLLRPTAGRVFIGGEDVFGLNDRDLSRLRNRKIGFVFQFHHLLPEFSAVENVMLPLLIGRGDAGDAERRARELLAAVALSDRAHHSTSELSGGEQQRVAVARALATSPDLVLADEPSGNLDDHTSEELHRLIWDLRDRFGQTFVIVTHDEEFADRADRKMRLHEGRIRSENPVPGEGGGEHS